MRIEELRIRYEIPDTRPGEVNLVEAEQIIASAYGVVAINQLWFRWHPQAPVSLRDAGIRYIPPETCGQLCQNFDTASVILRRGRVTCLGAAPYVLAHMRNRGEQGWLWLAPMLESQGWTPSVRVVPHQYHLVIQTPAGILDPVADLLAAEDAQPGTCRACAGASP